MSDRSVIAEATITCPTCGHRQLEEMPVNACIYLYDCNGCGRLLRPKLGDCCMRLARTSASDTIHALQLFSVSG